MGGLWRGGENAGADASGSGGWRGEVSPGRSPCKGTEGREGGPVISSRAWSQPVPGEGVCELRTSPHNTAPSESLTQKLRAVFSP